MRGSKRFFQCVLIFIICMGVIIIRLALTPTVDVFSYTAFRGYPNPETGATQTIEVRFNQEHFTEDVCRIRPKADRQDVLALAKSIEFKVEFLDPPGQFRNPEEKLQPRSRVSLSSYDKHLMRKIGIRFYCYSLDD